MRKLETINPTMCTDHICTMRIIITDTRMAKYTEYRFHRL